MKDLKAFLDGELDAISRDRVAAQLQADTSLAATADAFRRITASFAAVTEGPAVTGRSRVLEAIANPRPQGVSFARASLLVGSAAVVTLIAMSLLNSPRLVGGMVESEAAAPLYDSVNAAPARESAAAGGADLQSMQPGEPSPTERKGRVLASPQNEALSMPESPNRESYAPAERHVIRTGMIELRVDSVEQVEREVTRYVESINGYIEDTSSNGLSGARPQISLTVRVPEPKVTEAFETFEGMGERLDKNLRSNDVTEEIVDMDARLRNLRAEEETYRTILRQAKKIGEIIDIQGRIHAVRGEIESMQAQRDTTARLAALSTIEVILIQRPKGEEPEAGWFEDSWTNATSGLGAALRNLSVGAVWIAVYSPIWLPLLIVGTWGWRRALRA